jgi:hypothetical protein
MSRACSRSSVTESTRNNLYSAAGGWDAEESYSDSDEGGSAVEGGGDSFAEGDSVVERGGDSFAGGDSAVERGGDGFAEGNSAMENSGDGLAQQEDENGVAPQGHESDSGAERGHADGGSDSGAEGGHADGSSSYWTVYKFFASQSQHKYKIIIFFFRRSK